MEDEKDTIRIFEVMGHIYEGNRATDSFCACVETEIEAFDWVRSRYDDLYNDRAADADDATMAADIVEIAIPVDSIAAVLCHRLDGSILDGEVDDQEGITRRLVHAARHRLR